MTYSALSNYSPFLVWDLNPGGRKYKDIREFQAVVTSWSRAHAYANKKQKSSSHDITNGLFVAEKLDKYWDSSSLQLNDKYTELRLCYAVMNKEINHNKM